MMSIRTAFHCSSSALMTGPTLFQKRLCSCSSGGGCDHGGGSTGRGGGAGRSAGKAIDDGSGDDGGGVHGAAAAAFAARRLGRGCGDFGGDFGDLPPRSARDGGGNSGGSPSDDELEAGRDELASRILIGVRSLLRGRARGAVRREDGEDGGRGSVFGVDGSGAKRRGVIVSLLPGGVERRAVFASIAAARRARARASATSPPF